MSSHHRRASESRGPSTNTSTSPSHEVRAWQPGVFDYQRLDAYEVALRALVEGDRLARQLPRGYAKLADQPRRALLSAHLGVAEADIPARDAPPGATASASRRHAPRAPRRG